MKQKCMALVFSAFLALGVLGGVLPQSAEAAASVGYINVQKVFESNAEVQNARSIMEVEQQKAEKEFAAKTKDMSDKDKAAYADKLREQLSKKNGELMEPIQKKIRKAIETAAKAKGVDTVIEADAIVYGGLDLTADVIKAVK